jgi:hypothetical protein
MQGQFGHGSPVVTGLSVHLVKSFPDGSSGAGGRTALVRGRRFSFPKLFLIPVVLTRRTAARHSFAFPSR